VTVSISAWWKGELLSLGAYPDVALRRAREMRDDARRLLADSIDPSARRQADKAALGNTFEVVAREWLDLVKESIKESTFERERSQLERFVFPELGDRPVSQAPVVKQHYPAIVEPLGAGELLRAIDDYVGQPTTVAALKLAPYLFVRPGELRMMEHSELNLDAAEWRIPGARMKMGEPHVMPLSSQAGAILRVES
jgi:integrase